MADDLLDGIARYLAALNLLTYDPDGTTGDTFIETLPAAPDEAIALTLYGGAPLDSKLPYDSPSLQVRTRAGADPRVSRTRARALYDALHGLGPITLPDGSRLLSCIAQQTPTSIGQDELGRHEHTVNFALELYSPSAHRPG